MKKICCSYIFVLYLNIDIGRLAQLVEHISYENGVTSSNLVLSTKFELTSSNLEK